MTKHELTIPSEALNAPESVEILRVWAANEGQHVSITSDLWKDGETWGIMLADLAHHITTMLEQQTKDNRVQILSNLLSGFHSEITCPVNDPTGSVSEK